MTDRATILARRARFVAAAIGAFAATPTPACSPCLKYVEHCDDASVRKLEISVPGRTYMGFDFCMGERFSAGALRVDHCGDDIDVTSTTVFATSDPEVIAFEGNMGLVRGYGRVTLTALQGGETASTEVLVLECARDAGPDVSDAAVDGASDATTDAETGD
ncbi:MAG: hypothetical protein IPJ34_30130 [Myxococcales bacterium]|nr:hypothetical protein [Myxococcales bacterium]